MGADKQAANATDLTDTGKEARSTASAGADRRKYPYSPSCKRGTLTLLIKVKKALVGAGSRYPAIRRWGHFARSLRSREDASVLLSDLEEIINHMKRHHLEGTDLSGLVDRFGEWTTEIYIEITPAGRAAAAADEILPTPANATSLEDILAHCSLTTPAVLSGS
ncbi:hypothetical protein BP00DRAFT_497270 [Aspergillus indologenus CBS 114.80]|uniref:Uncharacterized protein n=1 Tax=Aspergillus indologenus CBS 114.80 TaxID=1450541 RepID=A0A2V5I0G6_9EURO|nr:hypothetical protein BP00DRAFT_497270 [Aspergillus indologenus CBS 114.80]